MSRDKPHEMAGQQDDSEQPKKEGGTPQRSTSTMENATPVAGSSFAPPGKKQRVELEGNDNSDSEGDIDDIVKLLSNKDFVSALDKVLDESSSTASQKTNNKNKQKKEKKAKKKKRKKNNLWLIKPIIVDVMKYLTIKQIVRNRRINQFLRNLLHFKFICDNHDVYFEYSSKMLVDMAVKHQICDNICNIALWCFASLNRTVGQPIFEREKTKENDCKIQFDAFAKNDIGNGSNHHEKMYLCSMNSRTKAEIKNYPWILSSLPYELSMNEATGDCRVSPLDEIYTQLKNLKQKVKDIAHCPEKHVFGDVVSCFFFLFCACALCINIVKCSLYF